MGISSIFPDLYGQSTTSWRGVEGVRGCGKDPWAVSSSRAKPTPTPIDLVLFSTQRAALRYGASWNGFVCNKGRFIGFCSMSTPMSATQIQITLMTGDIVSSARQCHGLTSPTCSFFIKLQQLTLPRTWTGSEDNWSHFWTGYIFVAQSWEGLRRAYRQTRTLYLFSRARLRCILSLIFEQPLFLPPKNRQLEEAFIGWWGTCVSSSLFSCWRSRCLPNRACQFVD